MQYVWSLAEPGVLFHFHERIKSSHPVREREREREYGIVSKGMPNTIQQKGEKLLF